MSSRIVKISSRQNHPITSTKNLVDFDIPSGMYDLSKSYLNLNVELPSQNANNISLMNLEKSSATGVSVGTQDDNVGFVRHVNLRSLEKGMIENLRHVNLLKYNLQTYEQSVSKQTCSEIMSKMSPSKDENGLGSSNYRTLNKTGSVLSVDKAHNHVIRLKDMMNFCKNSYYDTQSKGDLQLHLELDVENVVAVQSVKNNDSYWTEIYDPNTFANGALADVASASTISTIATKRSFFDLHESPFYVGMSLRITSSNLTGSPADRQVTEIAENANGTLQLTFDTPLVFTAAAADIVCTSVTETTPSSPVFNFCELVLHQLENKQEDGDYEYTSYHLQEDSLSTASLNKGYYVNGMCKNIFVITPANNVDMRSSIQVNSYRTSIDNVYQQNRKIEFGTDRDPLHLSQIVKTWDNRDEMLTNTRGLVPKSENSQVDPFENSLQSFMICQPCPITASQKLVGIEIESQAPMGRFLLFEEVVKML